MQGAPPGFQIPPASSSSPLPPTHPPTHTHHPPTHTLTPHPTPPPLHLPPNDKHTDTPTQHRSTHNTTCTDKHTDSAGLLCSHAISEVWEKRHSEDLGRSWTSSLQLNFYSPVEASRRGEGLEKQLVAPKQVVSVARVCKGLDCNSQVTCEAGCDHFR